MLTDKDRFNALRRDIDILDDQILQLLNRRASVALEIGRLKSRQDLAVTDPTREALVLDRLATQAPNGPLPQEAVRAIYAAIIRACREIQII